MEILNDFVRLRAVEESDLPLLCKMLNDPWTESMTGGWSFPISGVAEQQWFSSYQAQKELRCIVDIDSHAVGMVGLVDLEWKNRTAEIFYKMTRDLTNRRRGDTLLAVQGVIGYGFRELGMNCIFSRVLAENEKSRRIMKNCGFRQEGVLRQRLYKGGAFHDQLIYSLLREEFDAR